MDADLIRLILLLTGAALVVGIWLWDRWQRGRGETSVEQHDDRFDAVPEQQWQELAPRDDAPAEEAEPVLVTPSTAAADTEPEHLPAIQAGIGSDRDPLPALALPREGEPSSAPHGEASLHRAPDADAAPAEPQRPSMQVPPGRDETVVAPDDAAAELSLVATEPAEAELPQIRRESPWLNGQEPLVPAFLLADDEPAATRRPPPEPTTPRQSADRRQSAAPAERDARHRRPGTLPDRTPDAEPALVIERDREPEIPVLELEAESIDNPARVARGGARELPARPKVEAAPVTIRNDEDQFDLDLGFTAVDDQDLQDAVADLPELIVQINVVAKKGQPFSGEQILAAMEQVELRAGEHDIFHRLDNRSAGGGKPKTLFSVASMVEPGSFPLRKMKDFSTPGLTLFAQLPGPRDGLLIYSDMLYVAERLARLLDARLKDGQRSTLTRQTIEHTRERIAEHKRQVTLRLRQASDRQRGRR